MSYVSYVPATHPGARHTPTPPLLPPSPPRRRRAATFAQYDGFPIYGPKGPGGVAMTHTDQGCSGAYCLDGCSGMELELPSLDAFK